MKRSIIFFSLFCILSTIVTGQTDLAVTKVLDAFSSKALAAQSVTLKFNLVTIDQIENTNNTIEGTIILNKDKYKLDLPDNTTWFNGSFSWNYLINEKEVTITKPEAEDDTFLSKPSSIFTLYKKGYKTKLISESTNLYEIDLYPEDLKSELVRIRLTISKPENELKVAEYKTKSGVTITLNVILYDLKTKYEPAFFIFDQTAYKGVEVVDLR